MPRLALLVAACLLLLRGGAEAAPKKPGHTPSAKGSRHPAAAAHAAKPGPKAPPSPPELILTFDDGPHPDRTPRVLDTLEKHHLHAVFFVNGWHFQGDSPSAEKERALLREEIARGHLVGNHTIHHYFLCGKVYARRADEEIEGNAQLIEQAIGHKPELYRTPYGSHCPQLSATLARLGVKHTGWDIDPQDWRVQNTAKVRDYVIAQLKRWKSGRQILLMHDIHECTAEALPQILDWLDGENAERVKRGEPPIRILEPTVLLPPRPAPAPLPPVVDQIGRILIEAWRPPDPARLVGLLTGRAPRS